ncbi:MAG: hypothetical protein FWC51_03415 [Proteobacteria bacterium]|nr:hypothetical protein [Pseudomonadota bacterium]
MKFNWKLFAICAVLCVLAPMAARADYGIVDALSLSQFVPIVFGAFMSVAMTGYDFFVGGGTGIIYLLIYGFVGLFIVTYLVKQYFPDAWLDFFGAAKPGDSVWNGKLTAMNMSQNVLKPILRAIIAATIFLQVKPQYVTQFVVDPFLRFGAIYTDSISKSVTQANEFAGVAKRMECPPDIVEKGYISAESCRFIVQPVEDITHANNMIIKRGLDFFTKGLLGMMTLIPHGGADFMNLITGAILILTFVSSNFFMALLIIQAIFTFGMALILYPFKVLMYVGKPTNPNSWIDPWDSFSGIIQSLKALVITMIAAMFIMVVNIAAISALFKWNNSVFMVAAGGSASNNLPGVYGGSSLGFGQHSITWLSALLTLYLMFRIFELTREQLTKYTTENKGDLYKNVTGDMKQVWKNTKTWTGKTVNATEWAKNTKLGKWVGDKLTGKS